MTAMTETQRMVRDMARNFARDRLRSKAAERDRTGTFPAAEIKEMGRLGLMGMTIAEKWGGAGFDYVSYVLALEEIAAGEGGTATIMSVNNAPFASAIEKFGSDAQKEKFLRPAAKGDILGAFCLTEPHTGSDASNLRTRARLVGNKYVLSGTKQFITSGSTADVALTFAVTDPAAGKRGISAFLVPTKTKGYVVASVEKKLGQKCSDTCQVVFEDCEVEPDLMLGQPGEGYKIALANLETGRIAIGAQAVGMARAAFEAALAYAQERESFGVKIIEHQAVAFRLAEMATQIEAGHQLTQHAARLKDEGKPCLREAAMTKLFCSEMAERVCSDAIQIHGGNGYLADFPVERIYRDVRVCQIYEGTSDIQKIVISRSLKGD
jgi:alkylation response protein AidB-like acyl-CoA dehydrogenase